MVAVGIPLGGPLNSLYRIKFGLPVEGGFQFSIIEQQELCFMRRAFLWLYGITRFFAKCVEENLRQLFLR